MADRLKDDLDIRLESLFRSEPLRDDGFSARVMSRVRRQMWVQRLTLPFAFAIGAAVSAKPIMQLATALPNLLASVPDYGINLEKLPINGLLQSSTIIMGTMSLAAVLMVGRMLED